MLPVGEAGLDSLLGPSGLNIYAVVLCNARWWDLMMWLGSSLDPTTCFIASSVLITTIASNSSSSLNSSQQSWGILCGLWWRGPLLFCSKVCWGCCVFSLCLLLGLHFSLCITSAHQISGVLGLYKVFLAFWMQVSIPERFQCILECESLPNGLVLWLTIFMYLVWSTHLSTSSFLKRLGVSWLVFFSIYFHASCVPAD